MGTIAILGSTEVDGELASQSLADMRSEAEAFDVIIGVDGQSPEAIPTILDWCIAEEVAYDLIVHPDVADDIPAAYINGADKVIKTKLVDSKTVERLVEYSGSHLLVLAGDEAPSDALKKAALVAHEAGIPVFDLADALTPIDFSEDTDDAPADQPDDQEAVEEKPDFEQLGVDGDADDAAAQAQLAEYANEADIPQAEQDAMSWTELAEKLNDLYDEANAAEPEPPKPVKATAKKAAAPAKAPAKAVAAEEPTGFTQAVLDAMPLKDLRSIGVQSGIEGAAKLGMKALKEALLGLDAPDVAEDAPAVPSPGKPLKNAPATGNAEVDEALSQIFTGLTRLANALSS